MIGKRKKLEEELANAKEQIEKLKNEKIQSLDQSRRNELRKLVLNRLHTAQLLKEIKSEIDQIGEEKIQDGGIIPYNNAKMQIDSLMEGKSWDNWFEAYFEKVYDNFLSRLKIDFPELTQKDCRMCQFILMSLKSREISLLMNISVRGVEISRYRLRKKLCIDSDTNTTSFLNEF